MSFWDGRRWIDDRQIQPPGKQPHTRRLRDCAATALMILGVVGVLSPFSQSYAAQPTITLSPSSAAVGTTVQVVGSGFPAKDDAQLVLDGSASGLPMLRVGRDGSAKARFVVPATGVGPHTLSAVSVGRPGKGNRAAIAPGAVLAASTLTVTAPVEAMTPAPSASAVASATSAPLASVAAAATPAPTALQLASPTPGATLATPLATESPTPSLAPPPNGGSDGWVVRQNGRLMLGGIPYRFVGLNIYNANSRWNCWYPMGAGQTLSDSLATIGTGENAFRAWFFQSLATTAGQRDWAAFDHTLSVARAHGQKVIVTLTNQWGDCEEFPSQYKDDSWYRQGYRTEIRSGTVPYRDWVAEVVARYRDDPTILAWQLINEAEVKISRYGECAAGAAATLKAWAADVSGLIKSIDAQHLVSIGTIGGGQCGADWTEYADLHSLPGIDLCEFHDYGAPYVAMPGSPWNGLQARIDQCASLGKPVFVGESGIGTDEVGGSAAERARLFEAKMRAGFDAGLAGYLVWTWNNLSVPATPLDVTPSDPSLQILQQF
jgi:mannan endo-1,4-beta-mannosidase